MSASIANRPDSPGSHRFIVPALVGLAVLVAGGGAWYVVAHRETDRDRGIRLANAGDVKAAEPLLAAAFERNPKDAAVAKALGLVWIANGKLAESAGPLDRWRELEPNDPDAHLVRIDQAMKLNRPAEAIPPARDLLALRPQSRQLREQLTFWLFLTGHSEEADIECRNCRAEGDSPSLKLLHAEIAHRLGDTARSQAMVDELLAAGHRTPPALTLRGALAIDAGNPAAAVPLLKEALARGGEGQSRARHFLGLALVQVGDEAGARRIQAEEQRHQAIGTWEKYGRLDGVGYRVVIAEGLLATGKPDEAYRILEEVLVKDPKCRAAHKLLADYHDAHGKPAAAAEHRRKITE